ASAASRRRFASRVSTVMTSSSLSSRAEAPATCAFDTEVSAIRRVRTVASSRAFMAAVRSRRSRSFSAAMASILPDGGGTARGCRKPPQMVPLTWSYADTQNAQGAAGYPGSGVTGPVIMAPWVHASTPARPHPGRRGRRRGVRLRQHPGAELVRPAPGRRPRSPRGIGTVAGAPPVRYAPDPRAAPAAVVAPVPGRAGPGSRREHRGLDRARTIRSAATRRAWPVAGPAWRLRLRLDPTLLAPSPALA